MLENWNHYNTPEELLACFPSSKAKFKPEDFPSFDADTLVTVMEAIHQSFPDVQWTFKNIKAGTEPHVVVCEGVRCSGTHTGAPYSFAPGFPAIPATHKFVQNDEEKLYFTLTPDTHKIRKVQIFALGCVTGPAGLYEQIGGKV